MLKAYAHTAKPKTSLSTATPTPASTSTVAPSTTASPTPTATSTSTGAVSPTPTSSSASWPEGATQNGWVNVFDGYGSMSMDSTGAVTLAPQASTSAGETHSALAESVASYGDLDVTTTMTTTSQLRTGSLPNAWEVGWLLWHYTDNSHFYYVSLKPTGLELGKEDPAYPGAQRFLVTTGTAYPIGSSHTVRVVQVANAITVYVDGAVAATFQDVERPYTAGNLGLYDEDSVATFSAPVVQ